MDERYQQVLIANLAHEAERYDEVVEAMSAVAKLDVELTAHERNLLTIGYKKVVDARRVAWRKFAILRQKELLQGHEQKAQQITDSMKKLEDELTTKCNEVLSLIDQHLLPSSKTDESVIFCNKLKGDYFRYLAEVKEGDDRNEVASQSLKVYQEATKIAMSALSPSDPERLCLSLNYSILHYDILNNHESAYNIAELAYDDAVKELDLRGIPSYMDMTPAERAKSEAVTKYVKQLEENLNLWSAIAEEEGKDRRTSWEVSYGSGTNATIMLSTVAIYLKVHDQESGDNGLGRKVSYPHIEH